MCSTAQHGLSSFHCFPQSCDSLQVCPMTLRIAIHKRYDDMLKELIDCVLMINVWD